MSSGKNNNKREQVKNERGCRKGEKEEERKKKKMKDRKEKIER